MSNNIREAFMKKLSLFKTFLLLLVINIIVGCSSSTIPADIKHRHGKDYHKIEKDYVSAPSSSDAIKHKHGKDLHKIETSQ